MPDRAWHERQLTRLANQYAKYEKAMTPKRNSVRWSAMFLNINEEEHNRQAAEEFILERWWDGHLVRVEQDRRATIGMLLGAHWSPGAECFIKYENFPDGRPGLITIMFDKDGNHIGTKPA